MSVSSNEGGRGRKRHSPLALIRLDEATNDRRRTTSFDWMKTELTATTDTRSGGLTSAQDSMAASSVDGVGFK